MLGISIEYIDIIKLSKFYIPEGPIYRDLLSRCLVEGFTKPKKEIKKLIPNNLPSIKRNTNDLVKLYI